jgi:hypothetical protein
MAATPEDPKMTSSQPDLHPPPRFQTGRAVAGLLMAIAGSLTLIGLVFIGNCSAPPCEKLLFELGLATTGLVSATAQGFVLGGLWMLWSVFRAARRPPA